LEATLFSLRLLFSLAGCTPDVAGADPAWQAPRLLRPATWVDAGRAPLADYQPQPDGPGRLKVWSPAQSFLGVFSPTGLAVVPAPSQLVQVRVKAWEEDAQWRVSLPSPPEIAGCVASGERDAAGRCLRRVVYDHGGLRAWWENRPAGLEQGFQLPAGPARVVVHLVVTGARVEVTGPREARFFVPDGRDLLYEGLRAWDGAGTELPAWMEQEEGGLRIVTDGRGAVGEITIDPILRNDDAITLSPAGLVGARFGASVAGAGDVDHDGYGDVLIGSPGFGVEAAGEGRAWLYRGGPGGLELTPAWTADPADQPDAAFGASVAGVGDVNSDGFDDVLIGAPGFDGEAVDEGRVWLYHGGPAGLSPQAAWSLDPADLEGANFGASVGGAGDVDADGFMDLVVGAPGWSGAAVGEGRAWLFEGGPSAPVERWAQDPTNQAGAGFGASVAGAGDTNGDGFGDVLIGSPNLDDEFVDQGRAWLYFGARAGLSRSVGWDDDAGPVTGQRFGTSVSAAGNINGDRFDDFIVGADPEGGVAPNLAWVYHGASAGVANFRVERTGNGANGLGAAVGAAGDVNGDGFEDVLAGAPRHVAGLVAQGSASLYAGNVLGDLRSSDNWSDTPTEQAGASFGASLAGVGDVDGDGLDDVVVGAPDFDAALVDQGRVWLYLGCLNLRESAGNLIDENCDGEIRCYADLDGDGFTAAASWVGSLDLDCDDPGERLLPSALADCDDSDAELYPVSEEIVGNLIDEDCDGRLLCLMDADGDGHASPGGETILSADLDCADATELLTSRLGLDCDDLSASVSPSAMEHPGDLVDEDCDGLLGCFWDQDLDGYTSQPPAQTEVASDRCVGPGLFMAGTVSVDCDDLDAARSPAAAEVCNGLDDDCDGRTDDEDASGLPGSRLWFVDNDGDGYGTPVAPETTCVVPPGYVAVDGDCLDTGDGAAGVYPGAPEQAANGRDEDCDGRDDCFVDADLDGFGGVLTAPGDNLVCGDQLSEATTSEDCLDVGPGAALVNPSVSEVCNGIDDDCDGLTDDEDPVRAGVVPWYVDEDGDGFAGSARTVLACAPPSGDGTPSDCDDEASPEVFPGAPEVAADGIDQDCDGLDACFVDEDRDGFGAGLAPAVGAWCGERPGEVATGGDCLDLGSGASSVWPGAPERCDGLDSDCDGLVDDDDPDRVGAPRWFADLDGDGAAGGAWLVESCLAPAGLLPEATDCLDEGPGAADVGPGALERVNDAIDQDCDGVDLCPVDLDGDGYGGPLVAPGDNLVCGDAAGEAATADDCLDAGPLGAQVSPGAEERCDGLDNDCDGLVDDADPDRVGGLPWYPDLDGDGFFGGGQPVFACAQPPGWSGVFSDCVDEGPGAADLYPGAVELVADGVDQDCDGADACPADLDGDGYGGAQTVAGDNLICGDALFEAIDRMDCRDVGPDAASVRPGGAEVCNGLDDDCDGLLDDADPDLGGGAAQYWLDLDGDGYAGAGSAVQSCTPPPGAYRTADDCDDSTIDVAPGAPERAADGIDQDCDGVDACWLDRDGDGVGGLLPGAGDDLTCGNQPGEVAAGGDCLDAGPLGPTVRPGAEERCDGLDNDCDGAVDDADLDVSVVPTWLPDLDGDGFAGPGDGVTACAAPPGHLATADDCDDAAADVNPVSPEICNSRDDDCDGLVDGADALAAPIPAWRDADLDGFGGNATPAWLPGCDAVPGFALVGGDCDDTDPTAAPGASERPYDGVDQDCDGADLDDLDLDGARGGPAGEDCDDQESGVRPGAEEAPDGVDQDCDGLVDDGTGLHDDDGDGLAEAGGDCDDAAAGVRSGATELCDGVDQDCDGAVDEGTACRDDDGDGYSELEGDCDDQQASVRPGGADVAGSGVDGDCDGVLTTSDQDGDGYAAAAGDCDDGSAVVSPGADEQVNGVDDDCDGLVDEGTSVRDDDGDRYSELAGDCDDGDPEVHPAATEREDNGRDDDCDGVVDEGGLRHDDDGDGYSEVDGDCDDLAADVSPVGVERPDGVDQDCDGAADEGLSDLDGDGYTALDGDCDDAQGWSRPGLPERCDNLDNNCDGRVDEGCATSPELNAPPESTEVGCGCASAGRGGGAGLLLLGLLRRRHRGM
jgi:hypothetical protein